MIQTHQPANAGRNVVTEFEIVIADTKLIPLTPRDDSLAVKTEAIELLESARPWIRYSSAKKNPKASSRIVLVLIQILIEIVVKPSESFVTFAFLVGNDFASIGYL